MLKDVPRTEAYQKAILGNKEQFEGKIVMDIGAGTGKKTNEKTFPYEKSSWSKSNQPKFSYYFLFLNLKNCQQEFFRYFALKLVLPKSMRSKLAAWPTSLGKLWPKMDSHT